MEYKKRHKFIYVFLRRLLGPLLQLYTGYRRQVVKPTTSNGRPAPTIIVANHTTDWDPVFLGLAFPKQMYFVASEHVTRWGFASRLIVALFAPIIRTKGKTDAKVGKQILRTLRDGHNVCMFAEGNRSFSGVTGPIYPATGKLVWASRAHLVTYKLVGGYFKQPRWCNKMRRGPVRGVVVNHYTPEELAKMGADGVNELIRRDIYEDAYATQKKAPQRYRGKGLAEYLETALYLCPACGALGSLRSGGDGFACACGLHGTHDEYGFLHGDGLRFTNVRDWDAWQAEETPALLEKTGAGEVCGADGFTLYSVAAQKGTETLATGRLSLDAGGLSIGNKRFAIGDIAELAIVSRQTMVFTAGGAGYELKSEAPASALMFQRFYNLLRARKTPSGEMDNL